ncbi:MAG: aspartate/glutamate racemase family protein [Gammaproteobacteria bacterium]|nr:aspartate/glutamate racemase family protein [Gammaproteobacteria bacterium]
MAADFEHQRDDRGAVAHGGKAVYGAALGVLMLEARFPRIPGDMGNAGTWPFPVHYHVVSGASPRRVVTRRAEGLLQAFLDGADELVRRGADGITSNCGFLSLFQRDIAAHCRVPVALSSLMQVPWVQSLLPPGRRVGIVTIARESLSHEHLLAAGVDPATPVAGTDEGRELTRVILGDETALDVRAAERDVLEAGAALAAAHADLGAIVLECTNMAPYARSLSAHTGLPVYDIYSFVTWFHAGLSPRRFPPP